MNPRFRYRFLGRAFGRYYWEGIDTLGRVGIVSCAVDRFWGRVIRP